jgi:hypothetical protein
MTIPVRAVRILAVVGLALVVTSGGAAGAASPSPGVPYTDANALGYIGLCDQAGHQVTSGNVNTIPFAWRAVSTQPAQAPYNSAWRTAILLAYQPQQGLAPGEWSGDELTASSRYSSPANPMAAATGGDDSLEDFIQEFHPKWDGFLELRIYLGTQNAQVFSLHYPTLNIHVTSDTWTAVEGGPVNCDAGTAESIESILLPTTTTSAPSVTTTPTRGPRQSVSPAPRQSVHPGGSKSASAGNTRGQVAHANAVLADSSRSTGHTWIVAIVLAVVVALMACTYLITRRRGQDSDSPDRVARNSSTKGH